MQTTTANAAAQPVSPTPRPAQPRKRDWGMTLRRWHRYVSTVAMAFLAYLSFTGIGLALDKYTGPPMEEGGAPPAPIAKEQAAALVRQTLSAARAKAPDGVGTVTIQVAMAEGKPVGTASFGRTSNVYSVDPQAGTITGSKPPVRSSSFRRKLHALLEGLHRGSILGIPGQVIDVLAGLSFVFLAISGIWIYFDMLRRRRKAGKPALFWTK